MGLHTVTDNKALGSINAIQRILGKDDMTLGDVVEYLRPSTVIYFQQLCFDALAEAVTE